MWYENGQVHGDRDVCYEGGEEWMPLKTLLFQARRRVAEGTGAAPKQKGGWTDGSWIRNSQSSTLDLGPMYASNITYGGNQMKNN